MNGLKANIDAKLSARIDHMSEYATKENWTYFKNTITEAMRENIPQKTIGGKQHATWINTRIKRLIRQKQRRYNAMLQRSIIHRRTGKCTGNSNTLSERP